MSEKWTIDENSNVVWFIIRDEDGNAVARTDTRVVAKDIIKEHNYHDRLIESLKHRCRACTPPKNIGCISCKVNQLLSEIEAGK